MRRDYVGFMNVICDRECFISWGCVLKKFNMSVLLASCKDSQFPYLPMCYKCWRLDGASKWQRRVTSKAFW